MPNAGHFKCPATGDDGCIAIQKNTNIGIDATAANTIENDGSAGTAVRFACVEGGVVGVNPPIIAGCCRTTAISSDRKRPAAGGYRAFGKRDADAVNASTTAANASANQFNLSTAGAVPLAGIYDEGLIDINTFPATSTTVAINCQFPAAGKDVCDQQTDAPASTSRNGWNQIAAV